MQVSATSQTPFELRHTVVEGTNPSAGHAVLVPSHDSAWSQTSVAERQTVPELLTTSAGQLPAPSQVSATSQMPAAGRQTLAVPMKASAGQDADEPVQFSAASH